jgi:hypothetical protein
MDIAAVVVQQLKQEVKQIEDAIAALERLRSGAKGSPRKGRPKGSKKKQDISIGASG